MLHMSMVYITHSDILTKLVGRSEFRYGIYTKNELGMHIEQCGHILPSTCSGWPPCRMQHHLQCVRQLSALQQWCSWILLRKWSRNHYGQVPGCSCRTLHRGCVEIDRTLISMLQSELQAPITSWLDSPQKMGQEPILCIPGRWLYQVAR